MKRLLFYIFIALCLVACDNKQKSQSNENHEILSEKDLRHANLLDGPLDFDYNDNLYPEFSK